MQANNSLREELIHSQGDGGDVEGVDGTGVNSMLPPPPPQSMYGSAANAALMRSYEAVKEDCALLRKRYDDLVSSHSAAVNKLECSQVSFTYLIAKCLVNCVEDLTIRIICCEKSKCVTIWSDCIVQDSNWVAIDFQITQAVVDGQFQV